MNKAAPFFIKLNAFLAAQKILAVEGDLSDAALTDAWAVLYDLAGYARPTQKWVGR